DHLLSRIEALPPARFPAGHGGLGRARATGSGTDDRLRLSARRTGLRLLGRRLLPRLGVLPADTQARASGEFADARGHFLPVASRVCVRHLCNY
ncbi:hypothetical protein, partial [Microbacterium gubbeenense]|uniref:hypothetical protein n=1 Tax=Microbacterium gubbeenense TaxID=159896 RepID=UPI003F97492B